MIRCCIFDLDGVIVDTARYHFEAWAALARRLGFEFSEAQAEATKGVSRMDSLSIVLRAGGAERRFTQAEKEALAAEKNAAYLERVGRMTVDDVLPGVRDFLVDLRRRGIEVVLGSASRNARTILERCALTPLFDAVVDGELVAHAKPDPEVFVRGAELVGVEPAFCVVFEDAAAGVEAARRAGMRAVGVGTTPLEGVAMQITCFEGLTYDKLICTIDL